MKRGGPLKRRKALERGSSLGSKPWRVTLVDGRTRTFVSREEAVEWARIQRCDAKVGRNALASRRPRAWRGVKRPPIPLEVDAVLERRSEGRCEAGLDGCTGHGTTRHHRLRRGQGGPDTVENLVVLCQSCHTDGPRAVHRNPKWAYSVGLLIRRSDGPPTEQWTRPNG